MFEKPQQEINVHSFEIMQVLPDGSALATVEDISVGTYKYITRREMEKIVPIVEIMDK